MFRFFTIEEMKDEIMTTGKLSEDQGSGHAWKMYIKGALEAKKLDSLTNVFGNDGVAALAIYLKKNPQSPIITFDDTTTTEPLNTFLESAIQTQNQALGKNFERLFGGSEAGKNIQTLEASGLLREGHGILSRLPKLQAFLLKNPHFQHIESIRLDDSNLSLTHIVVDMIQESNIHTPEQIRKLIKVFEAELQEAAKLIQIEEERLKTEAKNKKIDGWKSAFDVLDIKKEDLPQSIRFLYEDSDFSAELSSNEQNILKRLLVSKRTSLLEKYPDIEQESPQMQAISLLENFLKNKENQKIIQKNKNEAYVLQHPGTMEDIFRKQAQNPQDTQMVADVIRQSAQVTADQNILGNRLAKVNPSVLNQYGIPHNMSGLMSTPENVHRALQELHDNPHKTPDEEYLYQALLSISENIREQARAATTIRNIFPNDSATLRAIAKMNSSFAPEVLERNRAIYQYINDFTGPDVHLAPLPLHLAKIPPQSITPIKSLLPDVPSNIGAILPLDACTFHKDSATTGTISF